MKRHGRLAEINPCHGPCTLPKRSTAVKLVPKDRKTSAGALKPDLVHPAGPQTDHQKGLDLAQWVGPSCKHPILQTCWFCMLLVRATEFGFGLIGDFSQVNFPSSLLGGLAGHPNQVLFDDRSSGELIAQASECSLIASHHDSSAGHSIESMRHPDKRLRGIGDRQLLNQLRLQTGNRIEGLRQEVHWLVDHQKPRIFDQNFDGSGI